MENKKFIKLHKSILTSKDLDLYESVLLCIYLDKHFLHNGEVYVSDKIDAESLKIDRHYVSKKRKRLEELGYIRCESEKGKKTKIIINPKLIEMFN